MREILFRGKSIRGSDWEYGYVLMSVDGKKATIYEPQDAEFNAWCVFPHGVLPDTVGQFTGLLDKNGNKIFDGDIIQYLERRLMVWWNDESFQWQAKGVSGYDVITFEIHGDPDWTNIDFGWIASDTAIHGRMEAEVIGNKWDNHELLNP